MRRPVATVAMAVLVAVLCACSGGASTVSHTGSSSTRSNASTPSADLSNTYTLLSEDELAAALLGADDLPSGYSQDPPNADNGGAKYCGHGPDASKTHTNRNFTNGAGLSVKLASVGLSQYPTAEAAVASMEQIRDLLNACHGEVLNGVSVSYSITSTAEVGHPTLGIQVKSDTFTVLLQVAQVGPTVVLAGTGGLDSADSDLVSILLQKQVDRYERAALH